MQLSSLSMQRGQLLSSTHSQHQALHLHQQQQQRQHVHALRSAAAGTLARGPAAARTVALLMPAAAQPRRWQRWHTASSGEVETSQAAAAAAAAADATASGAEATSSGSIDEDVPSHPLPDMFGTQELITELQDQSSFGKRGEGWALAEFACIALLLIPPFTLTGLVDIAATLLITAGVVFMVYGVLSLGRYVSPLPLPRKNHQLVTSGMYAYLRHPQYGGLLMAAFGLAVITRSETRLALAALLWFVLDRKVRLEESSLLERYGQTYADYKAKVKRYLPYVF